MSHSVIESSSRGCSVFSRKLSISISILLQDKFNQLLSLLPDLREMAQRGEDFLYFKHMQGHAPHHTLLMEMLLAKRNDVVSKNH